jgi:hypothetical protein
MSNSPLTYILSAGRTAAHDYCSSPFIRGLREMAKIDLVICPHTHMSACKPAEDGTDTTEQLAMQSMHTRILRFTLYLTSRQLAVATI